ncbi:MAG: acetyl-CoA carboxylase biotin carboxyl carrier protein [Candidatus Puniceispirillaceae bacterium]
MSSADKSKSSLSKEAKLTSELAQILDDRDLTDIELETDTLSIRVSRTAAAQHVIAGAAPVAAAAPAPAPAPAAAATPAAPAPSTEDDLSAHAGAVKSPMVGTYYESAEPGAAPFVKEGDSVSKGQTICIIEAMKVMNTITAPQAGTVKHIACQNGQPVEFDQLLIVIE